MKHLIDRTWKIAPGEVSPHIGRAIRPFLSRFGYLVDCEHEHGLFCPDLDKAIQGYQAFHGLGQTGRLDPDTLASMARPRCELPDFFPKAGDSSQVAQFETATKWTRSQLKYWFRNDSADLPAAQPCGTM